MGTRGRSVNRESRIIRQHNEMLDKFMTCRALTEKLCENLSDADASVQSMEDASPAKWHLAHTSWFFETFILRDHISDYELYDAQFPFLFNSYYEAEGARHTRARRGLITRPSLDDVLQYRAHITASICEITSFSDIIIELLELGIHHEQQHQELLLTDILHLLSCNPTYPALWSEMELSTPVEPIQWIDGPSGVHAIGCEGDSFAFDCEGPRHNIILEPYAIADRTITNGEWLAFVKAGQYADPTHWLSDGWSWVQNNHIEAPLYWVRKEDDDYQFGLDGLHKLDKDAPVSHISLYEADAYASWAAENLPGFKGVRLPTEAEWEVLASRDDANIGNQLDQAGAVKAGQPVRNESVRNPEIDTQKDNPNFFGDVWEWTGSAYRPYPKFQAAAGAVGEYNGKFMSGQFVLRGGSCATPRGHVRHSYRNFFYPHQRWQFTGLRLAKYTN